MKIDIRLKQILEKHGLLGHGVISRLADESGVHRHTVARLYRNEIAVVSLDVLEKICIWLRDRGVPADELPHALFGSRPSGLWHAIAASGRVTIYIGEYYEANPPGSTWRWVARRDSTVVSDIVKALSTKSEIDAAIPEIRSAYVPFGFGPGRAQRLPEDTDRAKSTFDALRAEPGYSHILIGSQRVNYLVELAVADLFGCTPFVECRGKPGTPFYLIYRPFDHSAPSCFGGPRLPGSKRALAPGIHVADGKGGWTPFPWSENSSDAGVVITSYDPGSGRVDLTVFGFSGLGTMAAGMLLVERADAFWPATVETRGKRVGVHVVHASFDPPDPAAYNEGPKIRDVNVVTLGADALAPFLPGKGPRKR